MFSFSDMVLTEIFNVRGLGLLGKWIERKIVQVRIIYTLNLEVLSNANNYSAFSRVTIMYKFIA